MTKQLEICFLKPVIKSFPQNARWSLDLDSNILTQRKELGSVPVLDIQQNGKVCSQIGLNLRHVKQEKAYFSNLMGDIYLPQPNLIDLKRERDLFKIFSRIHYITATDPSISTLVFSKHYSFKIHISDEGLKYVLDKEANAHYESRIYSLLLKSEFKASAALLEEISTHRAAYDIVMTVMGEQYRYDFYSGLIELAKNKLERLSHSEEHREKLRHLKTHVKNAKEAGIGTHGLERELSRLECGLESGKVATPERIKQLQEQFRAVPSEPREANMPKYYMFADIVRLPTTLHERANEGYPKDIATYELTEPWHNVKAFPEIPAGDGAEGLIDILGFRGRRKIIFGEV